MALTEPQLFTLFFSWLLLCRVWQFGSLYCSINNFVSYFTVSASVFTLLAISIDRRRAIVYPLLPKSSRQCVLLTILLIWCLSGILSCPALIFSSIVQINRCEKDIRMFKPLCMDSNLTRICSDCKLKSCLVYRCSPSVACILVWPDGYQGSSMIDYM